MRRMEIIRALRQGVKQGSVDTDDLLHLMGHYSLDNETMACCGWDLEELEELLAQDIAAQRAVRRANNEKRLGSTQ